MMTAPGAAKTDGKAKPDDKKPRVDLYGDPLPPGAIARIGTVRLVLLTIASHWQRGWELLK